MVIRGYRSSDLDGCRALWAEMNQRHRDIYGGRLRSSRSWLDLMPATRGLAVS